MARLSVVSDPTAAAAWVTYLDDDLRCQESSTTSKTAWLRSLGVGCLNKSIGDKLKLYSPVRNLSNYPTRTLVTFQDSCLRHADTKDTEGRKNEEQTLLKPPLSLVICEDVSKPPETTEEASPLVFTTAEFFRYLKSSSWGGKKCLRVVGGDVLCMLLTALYILETRQLINSNRLYANLNNRIKSTSTRDNAQVFEEALSIEQQRLPDPYAPNKEFLYEKLNLEIVFYDKADASNIPYIVPDSGNNLNGTSQFVEQDVIQCPYALKMHKVNYVRLPENEDTDYKNTIEILQAELEALRSSEMDSDVSAPPHLPDKSTVSDKIEWVADDPYLVLETKVPKSRQFSTGSEFSRRKSISQKKSKFFSNKSSQSSSDVSATVFNVIEDEEVKSPEADSKSYHGSHHDTPDNQFSSFSEGSYSVIKSPSEFLKEDEEEPVLKRLNLTRNELYVTGLYNPRKENKISTKIKLERIKLPKIKQQSVNERKLFREFQEKLPFDIYDRFKCLTAEKHALVRRKTAPNIPRKQRMHRFSVPPVITWEEYSKEQEEMEMDSALINNLEKGVLERILTYSDQRHLDKKKEIENENKAKLAKNKNKNNTDYLMDSNLDQKEEESKENSFNNNFNVSNKYGTKRSQKLHSKKRCKLPPINTKKQTQVGRMRQKKHSLVPPQLTKTHRQTIGELGVTDNDKDQKLMIKIKNALYDKQFSNATQNERTSERTTANTPHISKSNLKDNNSKGQQVQDSESYAKANEAATVTNETNCNRNDNEVGGEDNPRKSDLSERNERIINDEDEDDRDLVRTDDSKKSSIHSETHYEASPDETLDSYQRQLKEYDCECSCQDCKCIFKSLGHFKDESPPIYYPIFLGKLRRDFRFLQHPERELKPKSELPESLFKLPEINCQDVCDNILMLLDTVMIRKEILTSSLGNSCITVTFSKPNNRKT